MRPANRREKQIAMLLEKCGSSVERTGVGRWDFEIANGKSVPATARLIEEWLVLHAPVIDRVVRPDLWELLQLNAALDGGSRFVMLPDNRSVHVRADLVFLDEEEPDGDAESHTGNAFADRLRDACAGLKTAFGRFHSRNRSQERRSHSLFASREQEERCSEAIRSRCGETVWQFSERSPGNLVIDLNAEAGFYQAVVQARGEGALVSAEIARWEQLPQLSRQALGLLLLKAGALLRLVRPAVEEHESHIGARFEVRFTSMPSAAELDLSFSFLSVACSLCGREARAVEDVVVAREYLESEGHAAERATASEAMLAAAD